MESLASLSLSDVVYSAQFTQSPGVFTGVVSFDPYASAFDANVGHFSFSLDLTGKISTK
jgi:hypothetical protein